MQQQQAWQNSCVVPKCQMAVACQYATFGSLSLLVQHASGQGSINGVSCLFLTCYMRTWREQAGHTPLTLCKLLHSAFEACQLVPWAAAVCKQNTVNTDLQLRPMLVTWRHR